MHQLVVNARQSVHWAEHYRSANILSMRCINTFVSSQYEHHSLLDVTRTTALPLQSMRHLVGKGRRLRAKQAVKELSGGPSTRQAVL